MYNGSDDENGNVEMDKLNTVFMLHTKAVQKRINNKLATCLKVVRKVTKNIIK